MPNVPDGGRCTRESLPTGARHASVARDGDLTCRVDVTAVVAAAAKAKLELELDGGPSSIVDDIGRLEPVWTGGTLDPQCSKREENGGERAS